MIFSRSYSYTAPKSSSDIKAALLGKHVQVHNLDFEVYEKEGIIKIIPHAEKVESIKTLPITHVKFANHGASTKMTIKSKMRRIDQGGPMLITLFSLFMLIGGISFYFTNNEFYAYVLIGISVVLFGAFWYRMESGYFDYVRKIRDYVKKQSGL